MRIGIFPGTFDPITLGHMEIIQRATRLVECLYVAVANNDEKKPSFSFQQRLAWVQKSVATLESINQIEVIAYNGLLVETAKNLHATVIIRGLRTSTDFSFEAQLASANKKLAPAIETIFLISQSHPLISSTIVKSIIRNQGDISDFVPSVVNLTDVPSQ